MSELELLYLSQLFRTYTVGLCLGVSTLVLTFYYFVVAKGHTEPAEKRMMHIAYNVLRIGMVLVVLSEITTLIYNYHVHNFIYWTDNPELLIRTTIFAVIVVNALAMQYGKISMWLGPVFAGGSWYAYFFFAIWIETETTYGVLFAGYIAWLVAFGIFLALLRLILTRNSQTAQLSPAGA